MSAIIHLNTYQNILKCKETVEIKSKTVLFCFKKQHFPYCHYLLLHSHTTIFFKRLNLIRIKHLKASEFQLYLDIYTIFIIFFLQHSMFRLVKKLPLNWSMWMPSILSSILNASIIKLCKVEVSYYLDFFPIHI